MNLMTKQFLRSSDADWNAVSRTVATYTSDAIRPHFATGKAALLVLTSAGSLVITFEVSNNGDDWYEPYDTTGSKINTVADGLTADRWVTFDLPVCEWIRFKFVLTVATSTVSAVYHQRESVR